MTHTRTFALLLGATALVAVSCGSETSDSLSQPLPAPTPSTVVENVDRSPESIPMTTVPTDRVAAPVTTAAESNLDSTPVDVPVALNINDPSTPLGGLCWAFTETLLVSAAERVNVDQTDTRSAVERLEQAARLVTEEQVAAMDTELHSFATDLALLIGNVEKAVMVSS